MKIKVGESLTVGVDVDLMWQCSNCHTSNLSKQNINATVINTTNATNKSQKKLSKILNELQQADITRRYDHANFTCKCSNCHKKEPWAQLYSKGLSYLSATLFSFLVAFIFIVICSFSSFYKSLLHGDSFGLVMLSMILGTAAVFAGIRLFNYLRLNNLRRKISQLNNTAIPVIAPHSSARHAQFLQMQHNIEMAKSFKQQKSF